LASARADIFYSIRYPDPAIKVNDTVKVNLETGKRRCLFWVSKE
jgi:hypothetical protein